MKCNKSGSALYMKCMYRDHNAGSCGWWVAGWWGGEEKFDVFDKALEITKEERAVFVSVMAGDLYEVLIRLELLFR